MTFGHGVLSRTSSTTLYRGWYSRLGGLSKFQGEFRGGQGGFQFVWFIVTGVFGPKVRFYRRSSEAGRSAKKLYAVYFPFHGQ